LEGVEERQGTTLGRDEADLHNFGGLLRLSWRLDGA